MWLHRAGIEMSIRIAVRRFCRPTDHAIQAAVQGEGVALGRSALVADDLAAGRLVRPFDLSLPAGFAYYVVYPSRALQRPNVKALRDRVMTEIQ
jgi:LysR family glycine cleavage system transcriptional activator